VSEADKALVKKISEEKVLGEWGARCTTTYPECVKVWNDTVGKARGVAIK
jgi:hypothetical protein